MNKSLLAGFRQSCRLISLKRAVLWRAHGGSFTRVPPSATSFPPFWVALWLNTGAQHHLMSSITVPFRSICCPSEMKTYNSAVLLFVFCSPGVKNAGLGVEEFCKSRVISAWSTRGCPSLCSMCAFSVCCVEDLLCEPRHFACGFFLHLLPSPEPVPSVMFLASSLP